MQPGVQVGGDAHAPQSSSFLIPGLGLFAVGMGLGVTSLIMSASSSRGVITATAILASQDNLRLCSDPEQAPFLCEVQQGEHVAAGTFRNLSALGFGLAGASLAATLIYLRAASGPSTPVHVQASAGVLPGGGSLVVMGSF